MGRKRTAGFSLIEVLVALLVLGLGVLTVASMQLTALRTTQQTGFQSAAVQLAAEMAETVRAALSRSTAASSLLLGLDLIAGQSHLQPPAKLCYQSDCAAPELAAFEIYEWQKKMATALPGARVQICAEAPGSSADRASWKCGGGRAASVVIKVGWREKAEKAESEPPPKLALTVVPHLP